MAPLQFQQQHIQQHHLLFSMQLRRTLHNLLLTWLVLRQLHLGLIRIQDMQQEP